MIDLWIRDKYTGTIHKIGDDVHDCLMVDDEGTVHYYNLQCGDGCEGYKSANKETLADKYPDRDWGKRATEYTSGYEFVPNTNEYGYPYDPTEKTGWISVSERLPEDEQEILFSTKTGRVHSGKYHDDDSANQWYSHKDKCRAWNNVVNAWQPLPQPYKAESEET